MNQLKLSKKMLTKVIVVGGVCIAISIIGYIILLFASVFGGIDVTRCIYSPGNCNVDQQDKEDVKP